MSRTLRFDRGLLVTVLALCAVGIIMIYSSSAVLALQKKGAPGYFFIRQSIWMGVGLVVLLAAFKIPLDFWKRRPVIVGLITAQAALMVWALLSPAINGSHRWIRLGSFTFQPSESAKLVLVLFAAYMLERRARGERTWVHVFLVLGCYMGFVGAAVLKQPDLGTAVVLGAILLCMLFMDGMPVRWMAAAGTLCAVLLALLIVSSPYRYQRFATFLHPEEDPQGSGFQARQSLIAVGSGGVLGRWGEGSQRLMFLPEPHTDFLYSMVGEELGLVGTVSVLIGYLVFGILGMRTATGVQDHFAALVAAGIVSWILIQALIHMGVALTLLPTKGLPLPFMSYGGSSLLVSLAGVGILLNVSQRR